MTKIAITLKLTEMGTPDHMAHAVAALQNLGIVPTDKIVLNLECLPGRETDILTRIDNALCTVPRSGRCDH